MYIIFSAECPIVKKRIFKFATIMTDFTEFKVPGGGGHEFHNLCPPSPVEAKNQVWSRWPK